MIHTGRHRQKRKLFISLPLFLAAIFFISASWSMYSLFKGLPNPEHISERSIAQSTTIYDRTGSVILYEIHGEEKRTIVHFIDIPQTVKQATLAAEDINFYQHAGVDFRGIARAVMINLVRGNITHGGNTITQQLIKNSLLTGERTYIRKAKEALLAILLERKYAKDEILEFLFIISS